MLTTFTRIMESAKIKRYGGMTYDNRSQDELVKQLQATVDVLTARVRELEGEMTEGLRRGERSDPQEPRRGDL